MPASQPNQLIAGGTAAQWTRLSTDLTQFRDTAQFNTKYSLGPLGVPPTVGEVPRLGGWDQDLRGLLAAGDQDPIPPEVHAIINLWSQGLAASFFNGTAILTPPAAFLDFNFAAVLLYHYLGLFIRRGMPRGARTDPNASNVAGGFPGPGA